MKYLALLGLVLLAGCLTRTYVMEKPRTNLEIQEGGNRGYLEGSSREAPAQNKFGDKRKISVLEVELGAHDRKTLNKPSAAQETVTAPVAEELTQETALEPQSIEKEGYQEYIVQKDDTLQKISQKFYGTTKKWHTIFKMNEETLKSPNKLYPGMKIKIWDAD